MAVETPALTTGADQPDPQLVTTRDELRDALTLLRTRAGLTVRQLAAAAGLPSATVGGYLTARHLPGPGNVTQFRAVLTALQVEAAQQPAWVDALARVRSATDGRTGSRTGVAPYRGLEPFRSSDRSIFFGRDAFVASILAAVRAVADEHPGDARLSEGAGAAGARLVFVVGASGTGKSSALRAGVAAAVGDDAVVITPGPRPAAALAEALGDGPPPRVLVVDQFEELFTLTPSDAERDAVIDALLALGPDSVLVAGLRADFYADVARDPRLLPALQHRQIVVPPMTVDELRTVVVGPATAAGVVVEDALVDAVLAELFPHRASEDGSSMIPRQNALPLLSHALLAAWEQRSRGPLGVADYRSAGGMAGAVQQSAEDAYAELSVEQEDTARRLFLRLVTVEDDQLPTRRRVSRAELEDLEPADDAAGRDATGDARSAVSVVLAAFVDRRLLTADGTSVEISHEALLVAWPRFAAWVAADLDGLRRRRRLNAAAQTWRDAGQDPHQLLRGAVLAASEDWAADPDKLADLTGLERDYLRASGTARDAREHAARRRTRTLRTAVAGLTVLVGVALVATVLALLAQAQADRRSTAAGLARDDALSREVAIESARARATDPTLAQQLGLQALRLSPTVDARSAVLDGVAGGTAGGFGVGVVERLAGPEGPTTLARSPDGRLLAVSNAATGAVEVYRLAGGHIGAAAASVRPHGGQVYALAFSPDGATLAVAGVGGTVVLASLTGVGATHSGPGTAAGRATAAGTVLPTVTAPGRFATSVEGLAFSPDGATLAAGGGYGIRLWDVRTPGRPVAWPAPGGLPATTAVQSLSWVMGGSLLVAGTTDGHVYDWRTTALRAPAGRLSLEDTTVDFVTPVPGTAATVLVGTRSRLVRYYDFADPAHPVAGRVITTDFTSWANCAVFSPDGRHLALGGADNKLLLLDARDPAAIVTATLNTQIVAVAFAGDGSALLAAGADGQVRSFPTDGPGITGLPGSVFAVAALPDGKRLLVATTGDAGNLGIWSAPGVAGPSRLLATMPVPAGFGPSDGVGAVSGDGRIVVTANATGGVALATLDAGNHFGAPVALVAARKLVENLAVSPDGGLVAAASDDGDVHVWDVRDPARPVTVGALPAGGEAVSVAFSPDGDTLASAGVDHLVHRWSLADPDHPVALPVLPAFDAYAYSVAFSPDSQTLAAGSADGTVRLWDVHDEQHARGIGRPFRGPSHYVYWLAFSPDGRTLAAAGGDGTLWTYSLARPAQPQQQLLLTAADPGSGTYTATFSPDGRYLIAGGAQAGVTVWPTDVAATARAICRGRGTPLTAGEWSSYLPGVPFAAQRLACP